MPDTLVIISNVCPRCSEEDLIEVPAKDAILWINEPHHCASCTEGLFEALMAHAD